MPLPVTATVAEAVTFALAEAVASALAGAITAAIAGAVSADMPLHADHRWHQMVQWRIQLVPRFRPWRGL